MAQDRSEIYRNAGLDGRLGFGRSPALLIVDMQYGFTDPDASPLATAMDEELAHIRRLVDACRPRNLPVVFTAIGFEPGHHADGGLWVEKSPSLRHLERGTRLVQVDERIPRTPDDVVIIKQYASAFFGTSLASLLTSRGVDTLIVTGCTTSGCVRASVVDAVSYGFRPIVPREAVGDRAREPHDANLFDMDKKYGDVMSVDEVEACLESLREPD